MMILVKIFFQQEENIDEFDMPFRKYGIPSLTF